MNILYISSGHKRIYEWFDECIKRALNSLGSSYSFFDPFEPTTNLNKVLNRQSFDLMLTMVGDKLSNKKLSIIKNHQIPTCIWLTEDPYYLRYTAEYFFHYDYVFTIDQASQRFYKSKQHKNVYHLPLATDLRTYRPPKENQKQLFDVTLVGYPYENRKEIIQTLIDETPYKIQLVGRWFNELTPSQRKRVSISPWKYPRKVSSIYNAGKINLNLLRPMTDKHNDIIRGVNNKSINNRTFDLAACQAFQIKQRVEDVYDYFEEEKEIVTFKNLEDCLEKIHYYLPRKQLRDQIAKEAYQKVISKHTFTNRLEKIFSIVNGN
ncbi:glycosyltransferase [Bacillus carboniphilus]|uniref:Glycosyltransferase n=1 Tax=Bacillus carboniphilus TaxID=86663 RepID=A0ABY9JW33_9BACI|nr:glycosyltransferase [Bacillus carboniphilus]WLR42968.1 glycosyltransferase [Bacillus carboniphilus]